MQPVRQQAAAFSQFQLHCQSPFFQTVRAVHSLLIHGHSPAHHACRPLTPRHALTYLIKPHRPVDCSTGAELKYNPGYVSRTVYRDGPQPGWGIFPYQAQSSQLLAKGRYLHLKQSHREEKAVVVCHDAGSSQSCRADVNQHQLCIASYTTAMSGDRRRVVTVLTAEGTGGIRRRA